MENNFLSTQVDRALLKFKENDRMLKKFDFKSDIDWLKSDKCFVNFNEGYFEFLYKVVHEIGLNDYRTNIFGNYESTHKGLRLIPQFSSKANDSIKRSHVIVEKAIDPFETGMVDIEFESNEFSNVCVRFENQFFYDISKKVTNNELPLLNKYFDSEESVRLAIYSCKDCININRTHGSVSAGKGRIVTENELDNRKYLFNLNNGDIYIGNANKKFRNELLRQMEKCYLSIACNSFGDIPDSLDRAELYIKSIFYGKERGYVYFKPFTIPESVQVEIMLLYNGTPALQYFDTDDSTWKKISQSQQITHKSPINIRLEMSCGDRIYDVVAVVLQ